MKVLEKLYDLIYWVRRRLGWRSYPRRRLDEQLKNVKKQVKKQEDDS